MTSRPHRHRDLLVLPTVRLVEGRNLNPASIRKLLKTGDTVVNLIGILNESGDRTFDQVHAKLPAEIAHECIRANVRRLIHIGALGTAADAPSAYLRSKAKGQEAILDAADKGLDCAVLRPSVIFGADDSFTHQFAMLLKMAKVAFPLISPDATMQPVYVGDVVRCIVHAMTVQRLECRCCDLAGPEVFTLAELVSIIDRLSGYRRRIIGLNPFLSGLVAGILQFAPGQPVTPDNLLSLKVPNVLSETSPRPYGMQSARFEETAKTWLQPTANRFDALRADAGR